MASSSEAARRNRGSPRNDRAGEVLSERLHSYPDGIGGALSDLDGAGAPADALEEINGTGRSA